MNIIVCIKQVPSSTKVQINPETGTLIRSSVESRMNPFDLYAIEAAVQMKEQLGGKIIVLTMGPMTAKEIIKEAFLLGADEGYILSDRDFAGADVLATSYTLSQGIRVIGEYDLIICGKQTTDGDTSQVGPAIAEHLGIPHVSWVKKISNVTENLLEVQQDLTNSVATIRLRYPCLITVETTVNQPRLPSYLLKKASADQRITVLSRPELPETDFPLYGQTGSSTSVERIFSPDLPPDSQIFTCKSAEAAEILIEKLRAAKLI